MPEVIRLLRPSGAILGDSVTDLLQRDRAGARLRATARRFQERTLDAFLSIRDAKDIKTSHRRVESAALDSRIDYPCYKSFDAFIDEVLSALQAGRIPVDLARAYLAHPVAMMHTDGAQAVANYFERMLA